MSAIPGLKKKLKSVRAVGKLSKAMKTVSSVKFAKLLKLFKNYAEYADEYRKMLGGGSADAPDAETVLIFGSERGFCGAFNNDVAQLAFDMCEAFDGHIIACGREMSRVLSEKGIRHEKTFTFSDVPTFDETEELYAYVLKLSENRKNYSVRFIRPLYKNTMTQIPSAECVMPDPDIAVGVSDGFLMFPDGETVKESLKRKGFRTFLYGAVLETALGAQASTLMTMRSAFDTASEYSEKLENEIHRQRQHDVTADVIETASERGSKGEDDD